jgi:hypothetical protein
MFWRLDTWKRLIRSIMPCITAKLQKMGYLTGNLIEITEF